MLDNLRCWIKNLDVEMGNDILVIIEKREVIHLKNKWATLMKTEVNQGNHDFSHSGPTTLHGALHILETDVDSAR